MRRHVSRRQNQREPRLERQHLMVRHTGKRPDCRRSRRSRSACRRIACSEREFSYWQRRSTGPAISGDRRATHSIFSLKDKVLRRSVETTEVKRTCAPDLSLRLFLQAGLLLRNFRALVRILRVQAEQFALRQYLVFHRVHRCSTVKCSAEIERLV